MKKTTKSKNLSHNLYSDNLSVNLADATALTLEELNANPIYPYLVMIGKEIQYANNIQDIIENIKNRNIQATIFKRMAPKAFCWKYYIDIADFEEQVECSDIK